jgi:hypothetical protein
MLNRRSLLLGFFGAAVAGLVAASLPDDVEAQTNPRHRRPPPRRPPRPRFERRPRPRRGYRWTSGRWVWNHTRRRYVWFPGRWVRRR